MPCKKKVHSTSSFFLVSFGLIFLYIFHKTYQFWQITSFKSFGLSPRALNIKSPSCKWWITIWDIILDKWWRLQTFVLIWSKNWICQSRGTPLDWFQFRLTCETEELTMLCFQWLFTYQVLLWCYNHNSCSYTSLTGDEAWKRSTAVPEDGRWLCPKNLFRHSGVW
jgi:hypothetical protein